MALDTAIRDGRIKRGDLLLLEAFGGGFTWGASLDPLLRLRRQLPTGAHINSRCDPYNAPHAPPSVRWPYRCILGVATAQAAEFWIAEGDEVFGEVQVIEARYEDTFVALARTYNVGYEELRQANPGVDEWLPGEGTKIIDPEPLCAAACAAARHRRQRRRAADVLLPRAVRSAARRRRAGLASCDYPSDQHRPHGLVDAARGTTITGKVANPSWYPPQSIRDEHAARNDTLPRVVPPGPDNPLGQHAMRLGLPGYLIHGTNKPSGVGMRVTHGCVRMFPEDIEALYKTVPTGTPVNIVNQP